MDLTLATKTTEKPSKPTETNEEKIETEHAPTAEVAVLQENILDDQEDQEINPLEILEPVDIDIALPDEPKEPMSKFLQEINSRDIEEEIDLDAYEDSLKRRHIVKKLARQEILNLIRKNEILATGLISAFGTLINIYHDKEKVRLTPEIVVKLSISELNKIVVHTELRIGQLLEKVRIQHKEITDQAAKIEAHENRIKDLAKKLENAEKDIGMKYRAELEKQTRIAKINWDSFHKANKDGRGYPFHIMFVYPGDKDNKYLVCDDKDAKNWRKTGDYRKATKIKLYSEAEKVLKRMNRAAKNNKKLTKTKYATIARVTLKTYPRDGI